MTTNSLPSRKPLASADIAQAVQALEPYMVDSLDQLVRAASPSGAETPAAMVAEELMLGLGLASERIVLQARALEHLPLYSPACCADGGRYNLLAIHAGGHGGRSVLFNGHLDVVPPGPEEMWRRPPYMPVVEDGWLYGRGAGDMKGGIVCALAAFKALRALGVQPAGQVGFNWVLEEECTGNGTLASIVALRAATTGATTGAATGAMTGMLARSRLGAFDAVLIPEPMGEQMIDAQVGVFWMQLTLTGRPAHAAMMSQGADPIAAGIAIIAGLRELEAEWNRPENRHPSYREHPHPLNFNFGRIEGGEWTSSVPCQCRLDVRIGFYPDMAVDDAKAAVAARVHAALAPLGGGVQVEIRYQGFHAPGCSFDLDQPALQVLAAAHQQVHGSPVARVATTATTDARHFRLMLDSPVTCYGPEARDIHGIDEAVSLASMSRVATTFALFLQQWCGTEPVRG